MRNAFIAVILVALSAALAGAQQLSLTVDDAHNLPTAVIVLKDGEQLVIRGDFEVRDDLVFFYLDHGRHPIFASIQTEVVDFEATGAANEELTNERRRAAVYYQLVEERRRRLLELSEGGYVNLPSPDAMLTQSPEPGAGPTGEFPPYELADLQAATETWWRDESARLFTALNAANARLSELQAAHDDLRMRLNRSPDAADAEQMRAQINEIMAEAQVDRATANIIGQRLTELSIAAENLRRPIDWLLPEQSRVVDETGDPQTVGQAQGGQTDQPATYDPDTLADADAQWWATERQRLEGVIADSEAQLAHLRGRYNEVVAERNEATTQAEQDRLSAQLEAIEGAIRDEQVRMQVARRDLDRLLAVARELGREEEAGLMREREDEEPR